MFSTATTWAADRPASPAGYSNSGAVSVPPSTSCGNVAVNGVIAVNRGSACAGVATSHTSSVIASTLSTPDTRPSTPPSAYTWVRGMRWPSTPNAVSAETGTETMLPPLNPWASGVSTMIVTVVRRSWASTVASMPTGVGDSGTS